MSDKLVSNINQIKQDMIMTESRDDFLAKLVHNRIRIKNLNYEKQFDKYLQLIETREVSSNDIVRLGSSLVSLSKLVDTSLLNLIKMFESYNKKFLK